MPRHARDKPIRVGLLPHMSAASISTELKPVNVRSPFRYSGLWGLRPPGASRCSARASLPTPRGEPRFGVDRTPSRPYPPLDGPLAADASGEVLQPVM